MKLISGDNIGKFKVEFVPTGTGDLTVPLIGDGSTWETYTFEITIPEVTTEIIIYPLWGEDSIVAYDNVDIVIPEEEVFASDIKLGTILTWDAENSENSYQPQKSYDGDEWEDVGPEIFGVDVNTAFDPGTAPFYRVEETEYVNTESALNGGFEVEVFSTPPCAESWVCFSPQTPGQVPTRITTDKRSGEASMRLAVINDASAEPNTSEIQQNIVNSGGFILPGESYDFSFWAKQISSGVSYVQSFQVQWLDDIGGILPGGIGFTGFAGGNGSWVEITAPNLVAPAGATSALIQIFGSTGAVAGAEALGEVLIDDLSLMTSASRPFETLDVELSQGVGVSWNSEEGVSYQPRRSLVDLGSFMDFGPPLIGDGDVQMVFDSITLDEQFYEVVPSP